MNDDIMQRSGVYLIYNTVSKCVYVGSAGQSFYIRFYGHISALRNGKHFNSHLQRSWNKHSETAFRFIIFEIIDDLNLIISREQYWIDMFRTTHQMYNVAPTAYSMLGMTVSIETRQRISRALKGRKGRSPSVATRRRLSVLARQRMSDPAHVERISQGVKQSYTPELRQSRSRQFERVYLGTFISPAGEYFVNITNMRAFCKGRGIACTDMRALYRGEHFVHRGWTYLRPDGTPHPSHVLPQACEQCGVMFQPAKASQFCSNRCKTAARYASGVDNVERACIVCGKTFVRNKYAHGTHQFCSRKCAAQSRIRQ